MKELIIGQNDAGQRLDKFLTKAVGTMPASLMYKAIRTKKIKVNRKRAEIGKILTEGDTIQLFLPDDLFPDESDTTSRLARLKPAFSIVYEDENILLCDKPAGLTVHEDDEGDRNTLIDQIQAYLFQKGEYDPRAEQSFAPALANRIDRNTEGIVIAAKNAAALRELNDLIRERRLTKQYLAAVHGRPEKESGTLRGYLFKDSASRTVTIRKKPFPGGKEILTKYRVLDENNGLSLLEIELLTGRTHQIRAHIASIGHPLLGEGKYGVNREDRKQGYRFQALCAYRLTFHGGALLSYLNEKTFSVPAGKISFLSLFPNAVIPKEP